METTNTIELTPAEQELIRIKREEEKLAQEKATLQRKAQEEKRVVELRKQIEKEKADGLRLSKELEKLFSELNQLAPNEYTFSTSEKAKQLSDYHYNNDEKEFFFKEEHKIITTVITHSQATIKAKDYFTEDRNILVAAFAK